MPRRISSRRRKRSASWWCMVRRSRHNLTNSQNHSGGAILSSKPNTVELRENRKRRKFFSRRRLSSSVPDVVLINNYTHRIFMKKNIITPYLPPTAGNFPPGFIDKQGYWLGFYLVPYAITYNTMLVPKQTAPKSFDDLLNPKWKGQISLEREEYLVTQSHMQYMGQAKGIEYFKRLARQNPILINGHSKQAVLLTAGEFPIIIYSDIARTEELKRKGAPIEWVTAEPHITVLVSAAITRE